MAHDDQARDPEERASGFAMADTGSMVSLTSSSSEESSLATDAEGEGKGEGGHVNLMMSDLFNQPPPSSVNITNSSDVRIGPSLHYNGPVTINQFLNLQHHGADGLEDIPLPQALLPGKGVVSGVASSGVGACAEGGKRAGGGGGGGGGAGATGALWWQRPKLLAAAAAFVVLLAGVVTMMTLLWPTSGGGSGSITSDPAASQQNKAAASRQNKVIHTTDSPPNPELQLENGQWIIPRSQWSEIEPDSRRPLHHPTPYVVIGHTAGVPCRGEDECFDVLRAYRDEHRSKWGQPDISYNFLIDLDGNIYEGRGWDATNNYDNWAKRCNLGVSLMGNFMNVNVTRAMARSLELLLRLGVTLGKLDARYRLVAHSQLTPTLSPGDNVRSLIEHWPNRCLSLCNVGVQCIEEEIPQVNTTTSSGNESGIR